ncbi:hypothetical protein CEP52_013713 [Fusarium oligoseptatum]|uniref:Uncharacterized protein n=1 Tax=Fusarium oligoseptatum TaxID=2604345 RepID=A0A428SS79_9HYPO|nr:hypothetical protein CEP52_013713 [Fusarium oligoseptatum]
MRRGTLELKSKFYPSSVSLANMRSTLASIVQSIIINGYDILSAGKPLSSAYAPFPMAAACIRSVRVRLHCQRGQVLRPAGFLLPMTAGAQLLSLDSV